MIAGKTLVPLVPVQSAALSGVDSLYSIVQMPRGIPVGTLAIGKASCGWRRALLRVLARRGTASAHRRRRKSANR